ncbi:polysaccharide pyruvyl transferase family protein [Photobacterium indicum]|uniref:polysaccharide pyruvyl transferase family protein n=1 Tax=Photobacterium indicum TaxID=81447 RepID=UPI003D11252F
MKVGVSGTFDVDNFGDLLFPLITDKKLSDFNCVAISPTGSKTSFSDANLPHEISSSLNDFNALVIGGGNIIRTSNTTLDTYKINNIGHNAYNNIWLSSCLSNIANDAPIIWNSPGVAEELLPELDEYVKKCLARTDYISVRDQQSKDLLLSVCNDADIHVVPDCAWQISEIFDKDELFSDFKKIVPNYDSKKYCVFHLNNRYINEKSTIELSRYIERICSHFKFEPILIAIGECHGDEALINSISGNLTIPYTKLVNLTSLKSVISLLAHSKAYFGSSMHGLITSASYSNAAICIANGKIKFEGIQDLFEGDKVIYDSWEQVIDNLDTINIIELSSASNKVHQVSSEKLDVHWNNIRKLILSSKSKIDFSNINSINDEINSVIINNLNEKINQSAKSLRKALRKLSEKSSENAVLNKNNNNLVEEFNLKYEVLLNEHKLLQRNNNRLKTKYKDLVLLTSRPHFKLMLKLASLGKRMPFSENIINYLKKIKHYTFEIVEARKTRFISQVDSDNPKVVWELSEDTIEQLKNYQELDNSKKKYAVVSALYGNSDQLMLPFAIRNDFDYFCFSDQKMNTHSLWKLCKSPYYHSEPARIARYIKMHLNSLFSEYDAVIWCDANIRFDDSIYTIFDEFIACDSDASFIKHPNRDCIYEEANACIKLSKDSSSTIQSQIQRYKEMNVKQNIGMFETGLYFIKPRNKNINKFYNAWWKEIVIGSRRDQLSVVPAIESSNLNVKLLLEPGVCVRTYPGTEIIPHKKLQNMVTPLALKPFESNKEPSLNFNQINNNNDLSVTTDVIICVYNALEDVKLCFDSVVKHSYDVVNKIIFVNDFSDAETSEYLAMIDGNYEKVHLINNETNLGYTKSANVGLKTSIADFRIILNSDTIVTKGWASKLTSAAFSSESIGVIGPISNAAGAQSVPSIKGTKGQTAINTLPEGYTIDDMNNLAELNVNNVFPAVPLIHGFCIGIKASVIEKIGYFDDVNFARYYGEENDYCLRAYREGFDLIVATDTYIFHSKSKSIEEEERILHMSKAGQRLRDIYGKQEMRDYCLQLENNPNLILNRKYFDAKCKN